MRAEILNFESPIGELQWVFITGMGKKDKSGNDRYATSLVLPSDSQQCKDFIATIKDYWDENKPPKAKKAKSYGFRPVLDDNDEETGFTAFSFWTGIVFPDGSPKIVKVFNAKGAEVALGQKKIGNGSRGRVKGAMGIYDQGAPDIGVTLYLNGIQLTKFVEFTGGVNFDEAEDEDGDGFEGIEDDGMHAISDDAEETPRPRL